MATGAVLSGGSGPLLRFERVLRRAPRLERAHAVLKLDDPIILPRGVLLAAAAAAITIDVALAAAVVCVIAPPYGIGTPLGLHRGAHRADIRCVMRHDGRHVGRVRQRDALPASVETLAVDCDKLVGVHVDDDLRGLLGGVERRWLTGEDSVPLPCLPTSQVELMVWRSGRRGGGGGRCSLLRQAAPAAAVQKADDQREDDAEGDGCERKHELDLAKPEKLAAEPAVGAHRPLGSAARRSAPLLRCSAATLLFPLEPRSSLEPRVHGALRWCLRSAATLLRCALLLFPL
eukprot:CAMPEP_0179839260 /NCGR_PEP_ID=MMETSP0982-20121206/1217_1 /TAXON_ID=483367 /ORGANISM="non described non described, Strain CCMP 2436" /LENGTH=288 /DNA_ID=CAMNT_0021722891 /DNA_START=189 /DNA_END=1050 /DNA_ORIENTATION=+